MRPSVNRPRERFYYVGRLPIPEGRPGASTMVPTGLARHTFVHTSLSQENTEYVPPFRSGKDGSLFFFFLSWLRFRPLCVAASSGSSDGVARNTGTTQPVVAQLVRGPYLTYSVILTTMPVSTCMNIWRYARVAQCYYKTYAMDLFHSTERTFRSPPDGEIPAV